MRLILFDIDQTLMESGGVGLRCMRVAARQVLGVDVFRDVHPDGKTDPQILQEALEAYAPADHERVLACYITVLQSELSQPDERRRLKPGVGPLLRALQPLQHIGLGLLTGNLETTARLKLQCLDIDSYFPVGAFGSDSARRIDLGPIARQRAEAHYGRSAHDLWIIGDTPMDIETGQACGARTLAVATGRHDEDTLAAAGADVVLHDLSHVDRVLNILVR